VRPVRDAYIVAAVRIPVGKVPGGLYANVRPDDMLAHVLRVAVQRCPGLDAGDVADVIAGCAMPEAEQGLNLARMAALLAGFPDRVPGMTVNRFCASGLEAVAIAADRIRLGEAEVVIAAGTESMSLIPMGGHRPRINPAVFAGGEHVAIAYGMGITAEKVAERYRVGREAQDRYAVESHRRAAAAIAAGEFADELVPYTIQVRVPDASGRAVLVQRRDALCDEGPRPDTSLDALEKLDPVFASNGSVTAGNSSQMSDGAAAIVLMSAAALERLDLAPLARFVSYSVAGVPPALMGIGPTAAVPLALKRAGISIDRLDWIELNEAFAAQTLAVMRELDLDHARVNPLGGAIALGHPLGATGAIRIATLVHGLRRRRLTYGMVTMCVGTGMGAAAVFESCDSI
jgi:acetyl-CoA acyltransferase